MNQLVLSPAVLLDVALSPAEIAEIWLGEAAPWVFVAAGIVVIGLIVLAVLLVRKSKSKNRKGSGKDE